MAYQLQATDDGVELDLQAGTALDLTTATRISMTVIDPNNGRQTYTAASSPDGTYATVTTTNTMFPFAGVFLVQLVATLDANKHRSSPTVPVTVGQRL